MSEQRLSSGKLLKGRISRPRLEFLDEPEVTRDELNGVSRDD
jgi:hypothetical protein